MPPDGNETKADADADIAHQQVAVFAKHKLQILTALESPAEAGLHAWVGVDKLQVLGD